MPALPPEKPDQPRELPPGTWGPPPVRRSVEKPEQAAQSVDEPAQSPSQKELDEEVQPRLSKRRAWLVIGGLFLLLLAGFGSAVLWAWQKYHFSEEALAKEARAYYDQGSFSAAQDKYEVLAKKFLSSENAPAYSFMAGWCNVCVALSNPDADLSAAAAQFDQFVKEHKKDQLMAENARVAGRHLLRLAKELAERNANPIDDSPLAVAQRIEHLRYALTALRPDALTNNESQQIDADLGRVRGAVERASKRRNVLAQLHKRDKETPMDALKRVRSLLSRMERELPGISEDSAAKAALAQLEEMHLASVVYQPAGEVPAPPPQLGIDDADVMLFAPLVPPAAPGRAPPNDPIVPALARGVLYALKQSNGELKWATRVGIDTTVLPLRVPASAFSPELLLVLSADTQTLSALNVQGDLVWEYHVGHPVLGRPIIIEQRAYLADFSGWVHEIELSGGQLLGRWFLGQPLTCGGAREGDTSRIYFPADDSCIYVLDVGPRARRCVTILYDGHPSGSLRGEPVIIPAAGDTAPGYLILNQTSGLDAMQLRVFELPLQDRHAPPLDLKPPPRFPGWTWFEPKQDGEKLAVLSDAGNLGLFGIRQPGNGDPALFPLLQPGGLDLSAFLHQATATANGRKRAYERGRALVVHMQGDDLWVLAHGRFQQLQLHMDWKKGPQAKPRWQTPLSLGSPLHEAQRIPGPHGSSIFVLVTQALQQQTCLATAAAETGQILWQRQLGLVCQGQPLALTPPGGGPPLLLALDQGGGLFALDPLQPHKPRFLPDAPALTEAPLVPPRLLPAADGLSAYEIAFPGAGHELLVRRIEWVDNERELRVQECKVKLLSQVGDAVLMPAGSPTVTASQLLIPMSDGNIKRLPLAELGKEEQPRIQTGPGWRDLRFPVVTPCTVLPLGDDRFLATNGNRTLSVFEWPLDKDKDWQRLPKEDQGEPLKPLEYLMAAPPVLLPSGKDQPPRVVVADAAGMLRLFTVATDGSLQPGLAWKLDGNLTAGPFVQAAPEGGWRLGCILDRRRLLWVDPEKKETLWSYDSGGPIILGQPQQIEDMLVLALQSGRYLALDPNTGQPKGPGYTLRTSAAPAATPMPFGPGRMFAPLSDGTALLLSVELLKKTDHRVTENIEKKTQK
jgi:outer membrane protein assembly factor BamB